jgi:hypothetical protein
MTPILISSPSKQICCASELPFDRKVQDYLTKSTVFRAEIFGNAALGTSFLVRKLLEFNAAGGRIHSAVGIVTRSLEGRKRDRDSISCRCKIFPSSLKRPDGVWAPHSHMFNGNRRIIFRGWSERVEAHANTAKVCRYGPLCSKLCHDNCFTCGEGKSSSSVSFVTACIPRNVGRK